MVQGWDAARRVTGARARQSSEEPRQWGALTPGVLVRHLVVRCASAAALTLLAATTATAQAPAQASSTSSTSSTPAAGAPDAARVAGARELLDLMKVGPAMLQGLEMGMTSQRAANPQVPEAFWTEFGARARRDLPKFIDSVAPIYAARFSAEELKQFAAFYRTPAGRHLADEGAALNMELMRAGQRWGVELAADVMKEMAAKGVMPGMP